MSERGASRAKEGLVIAELGDGLVVRHARRDDAEAMIALNGDVHRPYGIAEPDTFVQDWTRDLFERPHPTFDVPDFMVVEDTTTGRIVSTLNLISQTWSYGGVPFGVGRIELVGTHPDYRRRGLVRHQMEVVHRWSAERGELVQAISGIPWYYRQFGYEYALPFAFYNPGRVVARRDVPSLAEADSEPYRVRSAVPADVPFLVAVGELGRQRYLVTCVRDDALWRYELDGRSERDGDRPIVNVVEDAAGDAVGCIVHTGRVRDGTLTVGTFEMASASLWRAVIPSVLRHLTGVGEGYASRQQDESLTAVAFHLGQEHPAYRWLPAPSEAAQRLSAWYIRVPDVPAFLLRVAPVIEARLSQSGAANLTGDVLLNFFRSGLRLTFERGHLAAVEPWEPVPPLADASFPDLNFLQLLFGYRSLAELVDTFPDCFARDRQAAALIDALFPKRPSLVWPVA